MAWNPHPSPHRTKKTYSKPSIHSFLKTKEKTLDLDRSDPLAILKLSFAFLSRTKARNASQLINEEALTTIWLFIQYRKNYSNPYPAWTVKSFLELSLIHATPMKLHLKRERLPLMIFSKDHSDFGKQELNVISVSI
ncbi:hypothetical protein [Pseudomonas chlororaphis]|uniref:hypothetical protein n=1 Tax=Pseudomonas chlororaphis TaxID=587753 RepID=UPI001B307BB8|nr:hypothetical protein [Pseudomonas chlororaphis]MBP5060350.1 hypothetical protein [Pseudomonas chlororaphis]MBP5143718.1 hypothetical protein [Pseudomonas chlororaphis]QTT98636.1 hypothetical protein HUT26_04975 [Pseudomonas chlororaphis]